MAWHMLPVTAGEEVRQEQIAEVRLAIVERRRAVGLGPSGDPQQVAAGSVCNAATIDTYRAAIEALVPCYRRTGSPGQAWTKETVMTAALGEGRTEWTNVPAGAGLVEGGELPPGTVMYAEHINDMKSVLDKLYIVGLEEKEGREVCRHDGTSWTWSTVDDNPALTVNAHGDEALGTSGEKGLSAPHAPVFTPTGDLDVEAIWVKGTLAGYGEDKTAKRVTFLSGGPESPAPTDRDWRAQIRVSQYRPAGSPREGTLEAYSNNLADDGSHVSDSSNAQPNSLEVYLEDEWGPVEAPLQGDWPLWLTFTLEDWAPVRNAYAAEAAATGRELGEWSALGRIEVTAMWAEIRFAYLAR